MWTIKINCRRFLGRLSINVMTLLFLQIHSETNIFLSTKVIWEREKRGFISYLSAWGSSRRICLKILPSRKNEIYLWKMATKLGMYSAIHESVTVARGQRLENTDRVKNQLDCRIRYRTLLKKKKKIYIYIFIKSVMDQFLKKHLFCRGVWSTKIKKLRGDLFTPLVKVQLL